MPRPQTGVRPEVEALDRRQVLSASHPSAALAEAARAFTPADLQGYADAYLSVRGGARYNPAYDFDGSGRIDRADVVPILKGLAASTPRVPFQLVISLAPGEQVAGHHLSNNGGVTRKAKVTVVGRTTPNSIIFTDGPTAYPGLQTGDYRFRGIPVVSDARGRFSYPVTLEVQGEGGSLTNTEYLVKDPFGHRVIRAFPIVRSR